MKGKFVRRLEGQADLIEQRKAAVMSVGEKVIYEILKSRGIRFEREHYFIDCLNKRTGRLLFFDFYLPDYKVAIEYDGIQHYRAVNGREQLDDLKARDKIKNKYCTDNGIYILRIRSYTLKDVESMLGEAICQKQYRFKKKEKKRSDPIKLPKVKKIKGQHPGRNMSKLKRKIELREEELEAKRNEARLKYPTDLRIYIATKK